MPEILTTPEGLHFVQTLIVYVHEGFPIIPRMLGGKLVDLDEFVWFECRYQNGTVSLFNRRNFFRRFMPSRLLFQNAGRG